MVKVEKTETVELLDAEAFSALKVTTKRQDGSVEDARELQGTAVNPDASGV